MGSEPLIGDEEQVEWLRAVRDRLQAERDLYEATLRVVWAYVDTAERPDAVWILDRIEEALRP